MKEYQVLVIMKDIPGVLSKISGLFSKRGFNINGITSGVSEKDG
ncbi:MAG: acetolactate synthase small subunit, partial [Fusobacteria bacterium]